MNNQEEYDVNDTTLLGAEDKSYIKMEFAIQVRGLFVSIRHFRKEKFQNVGCTLQISTTY